MTARPDITRCQETSYRPKRPCSEKYTVVGFINITAGVGFEVGSREESMVCVESFKKELDLRQREGCFLQGI